jgi:uncharacterized protein YbbC (DUF1343 family)
MTEATRSVYGLQYIAILLAALVASCASAQTPAGGVVDTTTPSAQVLPGIEVLLAGDMASLRGLRVGLITNHTGKLRDGSTTIDALHGDSRLKLVSLFAPEHGIRGTALAGVKIDNTVDASTGLPVHSLYGATRKPTAEMLANIDALVFDIQDIGARFYTYPWTMTLAMQAAAEQGKKFVVLDRPNPIGGMHVQGNVNDTLSFVGQYPVAIRHGMTVGEIARMINKEFDINADLTVIPVQGLTRSMWFENTGMPWTAPSPNMQTIEAATHYPGTCLFEGTNLSVGRGTKLGYEVIGAPWLDGAALLRRLASYNFRGVRFETVEFTPANPADKKFDGVPVKGIRFVTTDRAVYDPTRVAIAALIEIRKQHPQDFQWGGSFTRLMGNVTVRQQIEAGQSMQAITGPWAAQLAAFRKLREPYLLYR